MSNITLQYFKELIYEALRYTTPGDRKKVEAPLQLAYWELCELTDWIAMRRQVTIVFDGTRQAMPGNLIGITAVTASTPSPPITLIQCEESEKQWLFDSRPRWYYDTLGASGLPRYINAIESNGSGTPYTETCQIYYWARPEAFFSDNDVILLPGTRALLLKTVIDILDLIDKKGPDADRYRAEYAEEEAKLISRNPAAVPVAPRRLRHGYPVKRGGRG